MQAPSEAQRTAKYGMARVFALHIRICTTHRYRENGVALESMKGHDCLMLLLVYECPGRSRKILSLSPVVNVTKRAVSLVKHVALVAISQLGCAARFWTRLSTL